MLRQPHFVEVSRLESRTIFGSPDLGSRFGIAFLGSDVK